MKKIILFLVICLSVSSIKAANNSQLSTKSEKNKAITNVKSKPNRYVCWVAEVIYHSNGDITVNYRCKEICDVCGYALGEKKMQFNTKI